jgi:hypothetical protein
MGAADIEAAVHRSEPDAHAASSRQIVLSSTLKQSRTRIQSSVGHQGCLKATRRAEKSSPNGGNAPIAV